MAILEFDLARGNYILEAYTKRGTEQEIHGIYLDLTTLEQASFLHCCCAKCISALDHGTIGARAREERSSGHVCTTKLGLCRCSELYESKIWQYRENSTLLDM